MLVRAGDVRVCVYESRLQLSSKQSPIRQLQTSSSSKNIRNWIIIKPLIIRILSKRGSLEERFDKLSYYYRIFKVLSVKARILFWKVCSPVISSKSRHTCSTLKISVLILCAIAFYLLVSIKPVLKFKIDYIYTEGAAVAMYRMYEYLRVATRERHVQREGWGSSNNVSVWQSSGLTCLP